MAPGKVFLVGAGLPGRRVLVLGDGPAILTEAAVAAGAVTP